MNILFYSCQFYPSVGGLENVAKDLATEFTSMGWNVIVATQVPYAKPDTFPFRVVRVPAFWQEVKEMKDCDYVVMFNVSLKGLLQQILSGKKLIIVHQTTLFDVGKRKPWRQLLKRWVANNLAIKNIACSKYIGEIYKKVEVVLNPYNDKLFRKLNAGTRPKKFLFVGRLVSDKGCDILIKAFSMLVRKIAGDYTLTIIGDGKDKAMLQKMIHELGMDKRIFITGYYTGEQLAVEINNHEVMVVPSRVEPFGIVVLEGLACGCRMIVSNTGGLPEAAGGFANIFESENVEKLALSLEQEFLDNRKIDTIELANYLRTRAKKAVAECYANIIKNAG